MAKAPTFEFPEDAIPAQDDFPINDLRLSRSVYGAIRNDVKNTTKILVVTGFTSLNYLIDFFADTNAYPKLRQDNESVRILIGFEPIWRERKKWKRFDLATEIMDYWLEKGVSPAKSGAIIHLIELIKSKRVSFRIKDKCHAKMYIFDSAAVLGSSNFSQNGLKIQAEANIRLKAGSNNHQYNDAKKLADYFWEQGTDFNDKIVELLHNLVSTVSWEEALSRAVNEILNSNWLKQFPELFRALREMRIWPTQEEGILRGMQILREQGSLLIADPTGSGKTKMTTALQMTLTQWLWESGDRRLPFPVIICPSIVEDHWRRSLLDMKFNAATIIPAGKLSHTSEKNKVTVDDTIENSTIITLDEAHNYLNPTSNRSLAINNHSAEFVVLSTATPINKKSDDLLRLIQILEPENLNNDELALFKELRKNRNALHRHGQVEKLREFIWRFTLRRTKSQLNTIIKRQPELYTNKLGQPCCYPNNQHLTYKVVSSDSDNLIARKILELAKQLKGLVYLKQINKPDTVFLNTDESIAGYVNARIKSANGLSVYRVQMAMRSSRVALYELIHGSDASCSTFNLADNEKSKTGDIISSLEKLRSKLPTSAIDESFLPSWLKDMEEYAHTVEEEIRLYREIGQLTKELSDSRGKSKAQNLIELSRRFPLILAFDHTVLSLLEIRKQILDLNPSVKVLIAIGNGKERKKVLGEFSLGSKLTNTIALCSDNMSEGVNLQAAKALVMLDIPSVLRLAEQRVGRIDRMDSSHATIETHWPVDAEDFKLRTDRKLFFTAEVTKNILGSNLDLPEELIEENGDYQMESVDTNEIIDEFQKRSNEEQQWEGVKDAFQNVTDLIEGPYALVPSSIFEKQKEVKSKVNCQVSYVNHQTTFGFFCLKGNTERNPIWIFIDEANNFTTEYRTICEKLRSHLPAENCIQFESSSIDQYLQVIQKQEKQLLSNKKRRVLDASQKILNKQLQLPESFEIQNSIRTVLTLIQNNEHETDIDHLAGLLSKVLYPKLISIRKQNPTRYLGFDDLTKQKRIAYFQPEELEMIIEKAKREVPIENRIAACIIGVRSVTI